MNVLVDLVAKSTSKIIDDHGTIDGRELVERGQELAEYWAGLGLRPGDRIGLWLANGRRYLDAVVACAAGGFVAVSVNTRWSENEARTLLNRSGARWLRTATDDGAWSPGFSPTPLALPDGDRPFIVFTTSGTTSRPKMVLHGQRSITVHAGDAGRAFGYRPDRPVLVAMPLCGVFGLNSLAAALAAEAPVVLPSAINPADMAAIVERERIWSMNGSDDLFHRMLSTDADLSSLQVCGYGRFNTSLDGIVERAEARGMILTGVYGMSEVQALFSVRDPALNAAARQRAGGTVVAGQARARVVDDELQLRGPSLFAGYLADGGGSVDEALTALAFTEDGWFRTGDAASMDDPVEGRDTFDYQARTGDVLRLGGFLVAPAEIEAVLMGFPGVDGAQVVSVDRPSGARPVAFVTGTFSAHQPFDEPAAIAYCQERLARFKAPVRVLAIDAFPVTPSANGTKIKKVKLRALAAAALGDW